MSASALNTTSGEMHPVSQARQHLLDQALPINESIQQPLEKALGGIAAQSVRATLNVPAEDNSAVDGYALRAADVIAGQHLPVVARIHAGQFPAPLQPGTAARIFTGAPVPEGADTVVMQENCQIREDRLFIDTAVNTGSNIRRAGEDIRQGSEILCAGTRLCPQHLGQLASQGIDQVGLYRPLRVAVLATGDELVAPGKPLQPGQLYNSNSTQLIALLSELGCEPVMQQTVPDDAEATLSAFRQASERADVVISSGGVSVGDADYVKQTVRQLGSLDLWKVAIKPGKPLAFGRILETPFIGLPGNPVAVFVTFAIFVAPFLRRMQGRTHILPAAIRIPAGFHWPAGKREEYLRVMIDEGRLKAYPHQGSGVLSSVAWASGLARIAVGRDVQPDDLLEYYDFRALMF